jgi:hypothetical protein
MTERSVFDTSQRVDEASPAAAPLRSRISPSRWEEDRSRQTVRDSPLLSSSPVVRRSVGSLIQSSVNRVRSSRPN